MLSYQKMLLDLKNIVQGISLSQTQFPHLTLIFLGDQSLANVKKISNLLRDHLKLLENSQVVIGGISSFRPGFPRTVYLKAEVSSKIEDYRGAILAELNNREEFKNVGTQKKKFSPHLTLARNSNKKSMQSFLMEEKNLLALGEKIHWKFHPDEILLIARDRKDNDKQKILYTFRI